MEERTCNKCIHFKIKEGVRYCTGYGEWFILDKRIDDFTGMGCCENNRKNYWEEEE